MYMPLNFYDEFLQKHGDLILIIVINKLKTAFVIKTSINQGSKILHR